jgi:hypothetical protein
MATQDPGGCGGGGCLKVQRHPRTSVLSFGFALVTLAAFDASLAVPSVAQASLTGYKAPLKRAIQTQPQDGWQYTATTALNPALVVPPVSQARTEVYRASRPTVRQTESQTGWVTFAATPAFDPTLFQPPVSERTPDRAAKRFRYPLASSGFSTDGSSPSPVDTWDASKFQQIQGERPTKRRGYDPRYEYTTQSFGTLDARLLVPALNQLSQSDRMRARATAIPVAVDGAAWITQNLPVADVWTAAKFQNGIGERTPDRAAKAFRYPLLTPGFSTDGSSPAPADTWNASKFQNGTGDWTPEPRRYDPRYEHHKFPFGLLDARAVMPAITQLAESERAAPRRGRPIVTPDTYGWLATSIPTPFDPSLVVHVSDERARDKALYRRIPLLDQPSQAWITSGIPPFDPRFVVHSVFPERMADRTVLNVAGDVYYYDLSWLKASLSLVDPVPVLETSTYRPVYRPRRRA